MFDAQTAGKVSGSSSFLFLVLVAHWFFHLVIMFHKFLSFILFSFVVNHSESSVRSHSSSGCSGLRD